MRTTAMTTTTPRGCHPQRARKRKRSHRAAPCRNKTRGGSRKAPSLSFSPRTAPLGAERKWSDEIRHRLHPRCPHGSVRGVVPRHVGVCLMVGTQPRSGGWVHWSRLRKQPLFQPTAPLAPKHRTAHRFSRGEGI